MTDIDMAALRAAAEAATVPMTCGGHQSMGLLIRCEECRGRMDARDDFDDAISPAVVLALLDEVDQLRNKVADLTKAVVVLSPSQYARLTESEDAAALGFTEDLQSPQSDAQGRA